MDWNTPHKIRVEASTWIFFAVLILLLPLNWILAALAAAAVHELSHILMLKTLSIPVWEMHIGVRGAKLQTGPMTPKQEILCALAGPLGSFFLLFGVRILPRTALCGLFQGLFNLLPFYPLDGGRAVRSGINLLLGKRPCKQKKVGVQ